MEDTNNEIDWYWYTNQVDSQWAKELSTKAPIIQSVNRGSHHPNSVNSVNRSSHHHQQKLCHLDCVDRDSYLPVSMEGSSIWKLSIEASMIKSVYGEPCHLDSVQDNVTRHNIMLNRMNGSLGRNKGIIFKQQICIVAMKMQMGTTISRKQTKSMTRTVKIAWS